MVDEVYDVVDKQGNKVGTATWTEVHSKGLLHACASALIFRDESKQEVLIHRRSFLMAQDPGLLQHSAGGHVLAGQTPDQGIRTELQEELFKDRDLPKIKIKKVTTFFNNDIPNNHEILHLYAVTYPGPFYFDEKEVAEPPVWIKWPDLLEDMKNNPKNYAQVFHNIIKEYLKAIK